MDLSRFAQTQVIIIEGVPGAGKTTLQEHFRHAANTRPVSIFSEEALLFGWIHAWLPGIDTLRMSLMNRIIDHIEQTLVESPETLFVLTRFHISYRCFAKSLDVEAYDLLLGRLRNLAVVVLVPQIPPDAIAERAAHVERADPLWQAHLKKRLGNSGFSDIATMYTAEQEMVRQLLPRQQIRFEILEAIEPQRSV